MSDNPAPIPTRRTDAENETITTIWRAVEIRGSDDEAVKELRAYVASEVAKARCPHVVSGAEGTQYCALAESTVAKLTKEVAELNLVIRVEHDAFQASLAGLKQERDALMDENVKANGLLDMQMKERAVLLQDKARLDWIEAGAHALHYGLDCMVVVRGEDGMEFSGETWRAAVDAARASDVANSMRQAPVD